MDPLVAIRAAAGGPHSTTRTGLTVLGGGALAAIVVAVLASPVMRGAVPLPGPDAQRAAPTRTFPASRAQAQAQVRVRPELTLHQKAVARRAAVTRASGEVGVAEWGGSTNTGRRIMQYRRAVTTVGENPRSAEPWCADFVSWVWRGAGVPIGFGGRGSDYVPELVLWARLTGRWHASDRGGYRPLRGDLIVYRDGEGRKGHVGLVVRYNGSRLRTVEGNYRDRVSRRSVRLSDRSIIGFVSPV